MMSISGEADDGHAPQSEKKKTFTGEKERAKTLAIPLSGLVNLFFKNRSEKKKQILRMPFH